MAQGCLRIAENIKSYLDESIDACENFYEFACGNYIKNTIIAKGQGTRNLFIDVEDVVSGQLWPIISEPSQSAESHSIRLAKYFYASCVYDEESTEERTIKQMADILVELGGWPVVSGDSWQANNNFDWIETMKQFRRLGLNTKAIFALNHEVDSKDSSRRVLSVSCCTTDHRLIRTF